jgi:cation diffusion facilitator family transporter
VSRPDHHDHSHDGNGHSHGGHGHSHGGIDPSIAGSERGLWALKWSLAGLGVTAAFQLVVFVFSGSVALLADTIHNFGDALTALPLGAAFILSRRPATRRFPYGLHRAEDLAGLAVIALILFSAIVAGYESIRRLIDPSEPTALLAVAIAGAVGFLGNEAVAQFRISDGHKIGSAALIADGQHARIDGFTSLAVVAGAAGVWLGAPIADPIVGLAITVAILHITWTSAKAIGERILDGIDPDTLEQIETVAARTPGVREVGEVRARWLGHTIRIEANVAVADHASIAEAHHIATRVRHNLQDDIPFFGDAVVHVDPESQAGERAHDLATQ